MMTKIFTALVLVGILGIGIFGFATMNHEVGHSVGCIASAVDSVSCSEDIATMLAHHIQAFVSFFRTVPPNPFIFLLLLSSALFVSVWHLFTRQQNSILDSLISRQAEHDPERQLICPQKITHWLSLFENSPSLRRIYITISNFVNLCKQKNLETIRTTSLLTQPWSSILSVGWS